MHQPAYSLYDVLMLAGLDTTTNGYRIVPELPVKTFNVRFPDVGIAQQARLIRGYFRSSAGTVTMQVAPPPGVPARRAVAYANGRRVGATVNGGLVQFSLRTLGSRAANWAVTAAPQRTTRAKHRRRRLSSPPYTG